MAFADTARLIASLELEDKFSKTADKYNKALGAMERNTSTLDRVGFQVGRGARNAIDNIGRIAVVGAGLVASQVALGVRSLAELETVQNQTAAAIESTGGAANVSADHVRELSESLEDLTTIDDKAIQAGQNILLTFTNIRNEAGKGNDIFDQATTAVLDLATAMGTEPRTAALQLGKALNDPVRGLTALRRVGIQFTDEQTAQITAMDKAGDKLGAQKIIIAELNKEFGKSAEAFGQGPAATMRRFGDAVEGAQQALATGFLPVMERVSTLVQDALSDPQVLANIRSFGEGLAGGVEDLISIATRLPWQAIGNSFKVMGTGAKALLDAFTGLPSWVQTAVLTGWGLNKLTGGALGNIAGTLTASLTRGLFGQLRGATPATPVFTKEVGIPGVPGGGGGGGGLPPIGAGTLLTGAGLIIGTAALIAAAEGAFDRPGQHAIVREIVANRNQLNLNQLPGSSAQQTATPIGQFNRLNAGGTPTKVIVTNRADTFDADTYREAKANRLAGQDVATHIRTLEQRLLATTRQNLTPESFIRILRRTSEFGQKGVGTAIEQGPRTGRDPFGQVFVSLVKRLNDHALKDAAVQGEIKRHIIAAEEVQKTALKQGDVKAARKLQTTIDTLHRILGTEDKTNALLRDQNRKSDENKRAIEGGAQKQAAILERISGHTSSTATQTGIVARKDFSPSLSVTVPLTATTNVSVSDVIRSTTSAAFAQQKGSLILRAIG